MNDEQAPARTDTPGELASATLVGFRGEASRTMLALMSAAAVVFVAIATPSPGRKRAAARASARHRPW